MHWNRMESPNPNDTENACRSLFQPTQQTKKMYKGKHLSSNITILRNRIDTKINMNRINVEILTEGTVYNGVSKINLK